MIPDYHRPEAPVPKNWPQGPAYHDTGKDRHLPRAEELPWQKFFTDDRLQKTITIALENNRNLKTSALNVKRARAMYRIQRSELLPTVHAAANASKQNVPATTFGDIGQDIGSLTIEEYDVSLGISSWELDFFGRLRSLQKRALEEYLATEQARRSAQILLISEIARAWLALAAEREQLALARSTLKSQQEAYNLMRCRYEAGLATELDLRQTQTRVDTARGNVARRTEQVARAVNALNFLAGTRIPADICPRSLRGLTPINAITAGIPSEILLNRPDIQQAECRLKAANANIGAARAMLFPRISLTTAYGTTSNELSGLFQAGSRSWMLASQALLPIFDPRTWSALEVSTIDKEIALVQYEGAIQNAFKEVSDALARNGTIKDRLAAQQSLVEAAAETCRLANFRYKKGIDIYLTVLDAQRALFIAQQELIAIRLGELSNQVELYAVLGGGSGPAVPPEKASESHQ